MRCTSCSQPVRPVVAFDIDGTFGDYIGSLLDFAERWLGVQGTGWALTYDGSVRLAEHMGITDHVYRQMKLAYRQGGGKRMMPVFPGAIDLARMAYAAGAEVWFTTTRPYNRFDSTDPDTRHWLARHDIPWHHLLYDDDKYIRLVEQVDRGRVVAVLEDQGDQFDVAMALGLPVTLMKTRYNRAIRRPVEASTMAGARAKVLEAIETWEHK
jgi:hypothetical protein